MIICGNCGYQNESDDTFCGSCGTFLEWSAQPAQTAAVGATTGAGARPGAVPATPPAVDAAEAQRRAAAEAEEAERAEQAARAAAEEAAKAKAEAEARAKAEAEARAKVEAEARAKAAAERNAQEELRRRAQQEAEARHLAEAEAQKAESAASQAKAEAAVQARRDAELRLRQEADARAREAAQAKADAEAEARRRAEAEAKAKREAELQRRREAEALERAQAAEARAAEARAAALVAPPPASSAEASPTTTTGDGGRTGGARPAEVDRPGVKPQTPSRAPEPVKPAPPQPRPPAAVKAPPTREPQLGDLICEQCGEGNLRTRKFCRRCGASLFEAKQFVPPAIAAGERPMLRGGVGPRQASRADKLRRAAKLGTAALAALALYALIGPLRAPSRIVSLVRPGKFVPVAPVKAEGKSTSGHPADLAIDTNPLTYWSEGIPGTGQGATLTVTFAGPVHLDRIGIYSGAAEADFRKQPRPRNVHLVFFNDKGDALGQQRLGELEDSADEQVRNLEAKDKVSKVTITIDSVYLAVQNGGGSDASISEVEFWEKK